VAKLAQWVEQALGKEEGRAMPALVTQARPEALPLSFAQQRLWFLDQLEPGSTTYLIPSALRVGGVVDVQALESSLQELIRRHESLRTLFVEQAGQPMQVIQPVYRAPLPVIDLQGVEPARREQEVRRLAKQEALHACDLAKGPLLRTALLRLQHEEQVLLLTLHHIITDGWSNDVLVHELTTLYQAYVAGQPSPLTPLPIQYADYALWQRQWLQGETLRQQIEYWKKQLRGAKPLALPADFLHEDRQRNRGARYSFSFPMKLSEELVTLSRQEGVTLFMLLLAAFQVLLYRLTDQTDIVVGTDVANRTHVKTEELIGFFINLLALRTDVQRAQSFRKLLQQVRNMTLEAYTHQELPFEVIVEQLQLERREKQAPLVQTLFVLQNTPRNAVAMPGITFEPIEEEHISARFDLAVFLHESPQGIAGSIVYRTALFKEQTMATLKRRLEAILSDIVVRPDTSVDELEIYTDKEKAEQISSEERLYNTNRKSLRIKKSETLDLSELHSSLTKVEKDQ
jgi:NRPS condensation-like uncharacterized protein